MDDSRALVAETIARVERADRSSAEQARRAIDGKTKPRGSLGRLEELAMRVAAIRRTPHPAPLGPAIVVAAADHGIAAEGVSAYPQEVTAQMVRNLAAGGAAICVLSRVTGARLVVVDVGVAGEAIDRGVLDRRIGPGTRNSTCGPAMTTDDAFVSIATGIRLVRDLVADDVGIVGLGEMGIANSTSASAIVSALLHVDPVAVCGRGTGVDDEGLARKVDAVRRALAANADAIETGSPTQVLAALGGFELGLLAGATLEAAASRIAVVLDGFITSAAALVAARLAPPCTDSMIASHHSTEPGHRPVLEELGLAPILDLAMRLGEGTGAALAIPIVNASLALLDEMATFTQAGVTDAGA